MKNTKAACLGVCLLLLGSAAVAEQGTTQEVSLDIAAQPISDALNEFAHQAGLQVVFYTSVGAGLTSKPIAGSFTAEEALKQLLADTSLRYQFLNPHTVAIRSAKGSDGVMAEKTSAVQAEAQDRSLILAQAQTESQTEQTTKSDESRAAPALEEVVVTAEKRAESMQSLPIAISAFSAEMLTKRGIERVEDLQYLAPSLQVGGGVGPLAQVSMRGIGTEVGDFYGEPPIDVSQDGVVQANGWLLNTELFDVERVEVLRGPQGTVSGRNATAGAIHIYSKRPTETFEGGLKATLGSYNRLATEGYLSGPIIADRLLARLAVGTDRADGWATNTFLNQDVGVRDKLRARLSILAPLSEDFEAQLILEGLRDKATSVFVNDRRVRPDIQSLTEFYQIPAFDWDERTLQQDLPPVSNTEKYQATLKLAWDLGSSARLTSTSGYVHLDYFGLQDQNDGTLAPVLTWGVSDPLYAYLWQASQEFTLTADLNERLDLILGAHYLRSHVEEGGLLGLPLIGIPLGPLYVLAGTELTSWAGYTQWRYRLTDDLRLSAGIRYTRDSKDYFDRGVAFGTPNNLDAGASWSASTPRIALDYTPSDNLTFYANVARGFKSGGFNGFTSPVQKFEPEFVWSYEVGLKANLLDGRMSTTLAGFYMDYTNLQQSIAGIDPSTPFAMVVNANSASIKGVELEINALITDGFRIIGSGTWLNARYRSLFSHDPLYPELGVVGPAGVTVRDLSGNQIARAPDWQFNLTGEYTKPLSGDLEGVLRATYAWRDDVFFNFYNHESVSQSAYGIVDLSAAVKTSDERWQLSLDVRNLTDEYYRVGAGLITSFAPVPYSVGAAGQPRTFGVTFARRF